MDCKEALRWYERRWEEDRRRWEEEKEALEERLRAQTEEILRLRQRLNEGEAQAREALAACRRDLEKAQAAQERCQRDLAEARARLEALSHPPLGEGFFRRLAQALSLWDQALLQEATHLRGTGLGAWLKARWAEREAALDQALKGEPPDWPRIWTSLVLEWALLAWLEGMGDA